MKKFKTQTKKKQLTKYYVIICGGPLPFFPQQLTSQKFWYHSCVLGLPSSSNVEMIVAWASTNFFWLLYWSLTLQLLFLTCFHFLSS